MRSISGATVDISNQNHNILIKIMQYHHQKRYLINDFSITKLFTDQYE